MSRRAAQSYLIAWLLMICSILFWWSITEILFPPTELGQILRLVWALILAILPPVFFSRIIPSNRLGMWQMKEDLKTWGGMVTVVILIFLLVYEYNYLQSWWNAQPAFNAALAFLQVPLWFIGLVVVPGTFIYWDDEQSIMETMRESRLALLFEQQTQGDIRIMSTRLRQFVASLRKYNGIENAPYEVKVQLFTAVMLLIRDMSKNVGSIVSTAENMMETKLDIPPLYMNAGIHEMLRLTALVVKGELKSSDQLHLLLANAEWLLNIDLQASEGDVRRLSDKSLAKKIVAVEGAKKRRWLRFLTFSWPVWMNRPLFGKRTKKARKGNVVQQKRQTKRK